ncbi:hypothetical protein Hanom_Chr12g01072091 [Helianthus anomalus]
MSVSIRVCRSIYEHLSLYASPLLYIRARKSPCTQAPLYTSKHTCAGMRMLPYLRVYKSPYVLAPLHMSTLVSRRAFCYTCLSPCHTAALHKST